MDSRSSKRYRNTRIWLLGQYFSIFTLEALLEPLPVDIAEDVLLFQVVAKTLKIASKTSSKNHDFDLKDIQSDFFNPDIIISPISERSDSAPDDLKGPKVKFRFCACDFIIQTHLKLSSYLLLKHKVRKKSYHIYFLFIFDSEIFLFLT